MTGGYRRPLVGVFGLLIIVAGSLLVWQLVSTSSPVRTGSVLLVAIAFVLLAGAVVSVLLRGTSPNADEEIPQ